MITTIGKMAAKALAGLPSPETTQMLVSDWRPTLECYEPSISIAADIASRFVRDVAEKKSPYWLTFTGVPGCGKTSLARQIFAAAAPYNPGAGSLWVGGHGVYRASDRRPRCVWLTATEFADRLRAKEYDLPEYLAGDFLVALDDLGATRDTTDFLAEAVYRLCCAREGKWTLFTSNLHAKAISEQIDPRVASRMIRDGNIAHRITAQDYALRRRG